LIPLVVYAWGTVTVLVGALVGAWTLGYHPDRLLPFEILGLGFCACGAIVSTVLTKRRSDSPFFASRFFTSASIRTAARFAVGGIVGVVVGYAVGNVLNVFGSPYWLAAGLGYAVGFVANFVVQVRNKVVKIEDA
jgi:hypothetical protein